MWHRTALKICRINDLPRYFVNTLVPYWQVIVSWPNMLLKGGVLILIAIFYGWDIPIIIFIIDYSITIFIPIPHSFFLEKMEKRLRNPNVRLVRKKNIEENEKIKDTLLYAMRYAREWENL